MLMTNDPVPVNLVKVLSETPQVINIQVNQNIYRQQVLMHPDIIYAPAAARGFIVSFNNNALIL
jgi:hypothetical protein